MNWACAVCPETGTTDASEKRHRETNSHATSSAQHEPLVTPLCACGHRSAVHAYVLVEHPSGAVRGNVGRCLALGCACEGWTE